MRRLIRRHETDEQYWKLMARADQLKADLRAVEARSRGDDTELTGDSNSPLLRPMTHRGARPEQTWSNGSILP